MTHSSRPMAPAPIPSLHFFSVSTSQKSCILWNKVVVCFFFKMHIFSFIYITPMGLEQGNFEPWTFDSIATQSCRIPYEVSLISVMVFKHEIYFNVSWYWSMPKFSTLQKITSFLKERHIQIQYIWENHHFFPVNPIIKIDHF